LTSTSITVRLLLPLLFFATLPLAAQDPRLAQRFSEPVAARLAASIDSAAHDGLPTEPLVLRALEGQAKGASEDQIVAALSRLRGALRTARETLGPGAPSAELTTAAAALQAGVPEPRLAELHQLRGSMPVTAPLGAYLDLIARGAKADRAWNRISDLARRRASDVEFVRLTPADVDRDATPIRPSHPPASQGPP
jgi:hypothetical protein